MKYQIVILIVAYCLVFCGCSEKSRKNPVKRSGITIPSLMENLLSGTDNSRLARDSLSRMFLTDADDTEPLSLDLVKFLRHHQRSSIQQSRKKDRLANQYTEALVNVSTCFEQNTDCKFRVSGIYGHHSPLPKKNVRGRLVHVLDEIEGSTHYGCSNKITNAMSTSDPWIALISRGNCSFLKKIRLAEKYNASTVIIYNKDATNRVEVMKTVGTRIPSLMINSSSGEKLSVASRGATPVITEIRVGQKYIETLESASTERSLPTKAVIHFQSKHTGSPPKSIHNISSVIANHSPTKSVSGRLVHIQDFDAEDTHFGCSGIISNDDELRGTKGPWVALVSSGECSDLVKVKLAEKYFASAVLIYNRNYFEEEKPLDVLSAQIPTISLGVLDGIKSLEILEREEPFVFVDITVEKPKPAKRRHSSHSDTSPTGDATSAIRSQQSMTWIAVLLGTIFLNWR